MSSLARRSRTTPKARIVKANIAIKSRRLCHIFYSPSSGLLLCLCLQRHLGLPCTLSAAPKHIDSQHAEARGRVARRRDLGARQLERHRCRCRIQPAQYGAVSSTPGG